MDNPISPMFNHGFYGCFILGGLGITTEIKRNDSNMVIYWGEHGIYMEVS